MQALGEQASSLPQTLLPGPSSPRVQLIKKGFEGGKNYHTSCDMVGAFIQLLVAGKRGALGDTSTKGWKTWAAFLSLSLQNYLNNCWTSTETLLPSPPPPNKKKSHQGLKLFSRIYFVCSSWWWPDCTGEPPFCIVKQFPMPPPPLPPLGTKQISCNPSLLGNCLVLLSLSLSLSCTHVRLLRKMEWRFALLPTWSRACFSAGCHCTGFGTGQFCSALTWASPGAHFFPQGSHSFHYLLLLMFLQRARH